MWCSKPVLISTAIVIVLSLFASYQVGRASVMEDLIKAVEQLEIDSCTDTYSYTNDYSYKDSIW